MSNVEIYEMWDQDQRKEKENGKKNEESNETKNNLKGGDGMICSAECKKCGNG